MRQAVRTAATSLLARATNWALTKLRQGDDLALSCEEIRYARISFSQFGEDHSIVEFIEEDASIPPIYVDVGSYHPVHHSNTLLLHKRGWRGINIDLHADKIREFEALRPHDINLVAACSDGERDMLALEYGTMVTDRLAPLNQPDLPSVLGTPPTGRTPIRTTTLDAVLGTHRIGLIGYLNIDCEGHDLEVLKGISLDRHAPVIIGVEASPAEVQGLDDYLERFGYFCRRVHYRTRLYVKRDRLPGPAW
jgi:FkbM family methyltransferase